MVDETEFEIMDADERRDTPVVIRWFGDFWGICHAKSYQNAFGSSVNRFSTRGEAVAFAEDHDCVVEKHKHDRLQDWI
jgi:hypothetical protein